MSEVIARAGRILLVDDSLLALDAIGVALSDHGFDVSTTGSPNEALDLATGEAEPFDLFILDVRMPEMDGCELTRRLRRHERTAATPILLFTSLDSTDDRVAGLDAGADDFCAKVLPDAAMLARIRSFIALGQVRTQLIAQQQAVALAPDVDGDDEAIRTQRVMVLHDDPNKGERLAGDIRKAMGSECLVFHRDPAAKLDIAGADVVIASWALAAKGGHALLKRHTEIPPVLALDDVDASERRVAAFDAGADDYLSASTPIAELVARLASAMRRHRRQTRLREARDRAVLAATRDPLTGLFNRGYLQEAFALELKRASRSDRAMSVVMIDIDHFKNINDKFGHVVGDRTLREVAKRLLRTSRSTDTLARYGGEEFVVILAETGFANAMVFAEQFRAAIDGTLVEGDGKRRLVTISAGVASYPEHGIDAAELLAHADAALYMAKRTGRNRVCGASAGAELTAGPVGGKDPKHAPVAQRLQRLLSDELASALASVNDVAKPDAIQLGHSAQLERALARVRAVSEEALRELDELLG
ncbi:MAG TPA: diguanylate cyclase [Kofleriaceae bacterium]|nr:diguanylate cyclase [Kofleriaceae bacterium]